MTWAGRQIKRAGGLLHPALRRWWFCVRRSWCLVLRSRSAFDFVVRRLLERVAEAEHHDVDVRRLARNRRDVRRGLERVRNQVAAQSLQVVREPAVGIDGRARQDLGVDDTPADAPVGVQQVAEVRDVQTDLAGMAAAAEIRKQILADAQVECGGPSAGTPRCVPRTGRDASSGSCPTE